MMSNLTVIYDGSIEGFLSALRYLVLKNQIPRILISKEHHIPSIFEETLTIANDNEQDINSFMLYLCKRISVDVIKKILLAFLSEIKGFEMTTLNYITKGLKVGKNYTKYLSDDDALSVNEMCRKVRRECHRFYGLMRFSKTSEGVYYAPFEPDHNIISLIVPHFVDRLKDQTWIIHDIKRDIAVLYEHLSGQTLQVTINNDIVVEDEEKIINELWRSYFKSLAIQNRTNPKLQKRCMPKRYWKYLIEKNETTTARQPLPCPHHHKLV